MHKKISISSFFFCRFAIKYKLGIFVPYKFAVAFFVKNAHGTDLKRSRKRRSGDYDFKSDTSEYNRRAEEHYED